MISAWRYSHANSSLPVAVHPGPGSWNEMAKCVDWGSALVIGFGHILPTGRQCPVLCIRCS